MLKKLFGKKRREPKSFEEVKEDLLESIREESLNRKINSNMELLTDYFTEEKETEILDLQKDIYAMATSLPLAQSFAAMTATASLCDYGYYTDSLVDQIVEDYQQLLEKAKPFFDILHQKVKEGEEGELEEDLDVDSLYQQLINDQELISQELSKAVRKFEFTSRNMISILSINPSITLRNKSKLKDQIHSVKIYATSTYWIDRLFEVLYDEPIVVIDVDNNRGFEGKMSGVSDNFQLQLLLMSMQEINENPSFGGPELSVLNGTGVQMTNSIVEGKWNMYNLDIINQDGWEEIKIGPDKTYDLQDLWIWGEGTPKEISVHNGRRAILLGRTPVKRSTRLQRTFKNVKASIEVEKVLSPDEINQWLGLDK